MSCQELPSLIPTAQRQPWHLELGNRLGRGATIQLDEAPSLGLTQTWGRWGSVLQDGWELTPFVKGAG